MKQNVICRQYAIEEKAIRHIRNLKCTNRVGKNKVIKREFPEEKDV